MYHKNKLLTALAGGLLWLMSALTWAAAPALAPYEAAMARVVAELSEHRPEAFNQALDTDRILDTAFDGMMLDAQWKADVRRSFQAAIATRLGDKIVSQMPEEAYARLLRMKPQDQQVLALLRVDYGDMGTGYLDLHLMRGDDGAVRIVDWYDYSSGQLYTQSLRQLIALMSPTPTLLGKVFDVVSKRKDSVDGVVELMTLYGQKRYAETARRFLAMDAEMRRNRMLNIAAVQAANLSENDELYRRVLANLDRHFRKDPSMAFLLLDYYFIEGKYDWVLSALDQVEASFGVEDAAVIVLRSNALAGQGKFGPAQAQARRAVELEPSYENAYWSLLSAQVQGGEYAQAVQVARVLEDEFDYDMGPDSLGANEVYAAFAESAEYRRWRGAP